MKTGKYDMRFHSISVHFTSALYPVALLFLILSYYYQRDASLFTYFHLMVLAVLSSIVSQVTGIIEWKQRYKGAKIKIFTRKYRAGLLLSGLGIACTLWYGLQPEVMDYGGALHMLFLSMNLAIVPNLIYLGYLGGKLVFGGAH